MLSLNGKEILNTLIHTLKQQSHIQIKISEKKNNIFLLFPHFNKNIDEDKKILQLSVFDVFRIIIKMFKNPPGQSKSMLFGGLFSYDLISNFEILPDTKKIHKCPDFCFYLAETLLILDHQKKTCLIQNSLFTNNTDEKKRLKKRAKEIKIRLDHKLNLMPKKIIQTTPLTSNMNDLQYCSIIKKLQKFIAQGEIFQVVPSRKFFLPCPDPLSAYQELKKIIGRAP